MSNLHIDEALECPNCSSKSFSLKREASYLYIYKLDIPIANQQSENGEALPFLFDNREQLSDKEYLECDSCKRQYPCEIDASTNKVRLTILQRAIRSDHVINPEFLG